MITAADDEAGVDVAVDVVVDVDVDSGLGVLCSRRKWLLNENNEDRKGTLE